MIYLLLLSISLFSLSIDLSRQSCSLHGIGHTIMMYHREGHTALIVSSMYIAPKSR
jgi:hypothetical protein